MPGYSDPINHALAYAAKHHDQEVRKGTRAPYFTQPANIAVILTRYGQEEQTVVAGILHNVVQDYATAGVASEMLLARIVEKFGPAVLETAHAVTERRYDADGAEMAVSERRGDLLRRLDHASDASRWVYAAEAVHTGGTLIADLQRTQFPETVWRRYTAGRDGTIVWYRTLQVRLEEIGFRAPILEELTGMASALEQYR
jgi:hypothetical protein